MFTVGAFLLVMAAVWWAGRKNERERKVYDRETDDERLWPLILHIRQDLKLVAFLVAAVVVMLGVVADRIR